MTDTKIKEDLKEIKEELKSSIKSEIEIELGDSIKEELKEIKEELKSSIKSEIKIELGDSIKEDLKEDFFNFKFKSICEFIINNKVFIISSIVWITILIKLIIPNKVQYNIQNFLVFITLGLVDLLLILVEQLHCIYKSISSERYNVKYDVTIINMYVKIIKNIVIILGIISVLFFVKLYI